MCNGDWLITVTKQAVVGKRRLMSLLRMITEANFKDVVYIGKDAGPAAAAAARRQFT